MAWIRLDDRFARHRKIQQLGRHAYAKWLHVVALCYCGEHGTDGLVDEIAFRQIVADADVPLPAARRAVPWLVDAGLWIQHPERNGWLICDFLEYNPTAAEVKQRREKRAEAGRLGGLRSGEARAEAKSKQVLRGVLNPLPVPFPKDQVLLGVVESVDNSLRSVTG